MTNQSARAKKRKPKLDPSPAYLAELGAITFDSVLTDAQVEKFEADQAKWGQSRRCALITLARTRSQLVTGFGSASDAGHELLLEMIGTISDYEKYCKAMADISAVAIARLIAVAAATIEKPPA